jgi:hypothetical protein
MLRKHLTNNTKQSKVIDNGYETNNQITLANLSTIICKVIIFCLVQELLTILLRGDNKFEISNPIIRIL